VFPVRIWRKNNSVHSVDMDRGSTSAATRSTDAIASPELTSGRTFPLTAAAVYKLYRVTDTGPLTSFKVTSVPSGTMSPQRLRTCRIGTSFVWSRNWPSAWSVTCQCRPKALKLLTYDEPSSICMVWLTSSRFTPRDWT